MEKSGTAVRHPGYTNAVAPIARSLAVCAARDDKTPYDSRFSIRLSPAPESSWFHTRRRTTAPFLLGSRRAPGDLVARAAAPRWSIPSRPCAPNDRETPVSVAVVPGSTGCYPLVRRCLRRTRCSIAAEQIPASVSHHRPQRREDFPAPRDNIPGSPDSRTTRLNYTPLL